MRDRSKRNGNIEDPIIECVGNELDEFMGELLH
jgi:hypothetical protein